jgi:hypothetical protein
VRPAGRIGQIKFTLDANGIFMYGNAETGQYLSLLTISSMREAWRHSLENNAHYTPWMFVSDKPTQALLSLERIIGQSRQSLVIGVGREGSLLWSLPVSKELHAEEGAYFYAQSWASQASKLAISTDDRHFGVFQLSGKN